MIAALMRGLPGHRVPTSAENVGAVGSANGPRDELTSAVREDLSRTAGMDRRADCTVDTAPVTPRRLNDIMVMSAGLLLLMALAAAAFGQGPSSAPCNGSSWPSSHSRSRSRWPLVRC